MILDKENLFSDNQAITADAASTNIIDLGAPGTPVGGAAALTRDIGKGKPIDLLIQVTEDFDNLTSLDIEVQVDTVENFASPTVVMQHNVALADLVAGYVCPLQVVPPGTNQRYMRLYYDVNGTNPTAGKITAGVVLGGVQSNNV